jgi:hypothetical protein
VDAGVGALNRTQRASGYSLVTQIMKGHTRTRPAVAFHILVRPLGPTPSAADWMLGDRKLLDPANWDVRLLYSMRA